MVFVVNDTIWQLQFVNQASKNLYRSDGSRTIGVSDNTIKTVFIADNLTDKMVDKVLCHELVHVFCFENDYSIPIEVEEIIADFMSLYGRSIIYLADRIMSDLMRRVA